MDERFRTLALKASQLRQALSELPRNAEALVALYEAQSIPLGQVSGIASIARKVARIAEEMAVIERDISLNPPKEA